MRISSLLRSVACVAALSLYGQQTTPPAQETPKEAQKEAPGAESHGLPPRVAPTDYQAHAVMGKFTLAADFVEHGVPTPDSTFNSEEFVTVEAALYGPADSKVKVSIDDFSLRINGKKTALNSKQFGMVFASLKDPSWEPPEPAQPKSKGGLTTGGGGGGGQDNSPPPVVHMPMPLVHTMQLKVQKAAMPEGERALPVAGLLFFQYRGQVKGIKTVELIYSGPAGQTSLDLQP